MDFDFLSPETGLSASDQLYTARGAQGAGISQDKTDYLQVDPEDYTSTFLFLDLYHVYGGRFYE
jgi:hypothetical protein